MNPEQKDTIKKTVEKILNDHYDGAVGFNHISIIPDVDIHGEDIIRIIVVFDEDNPSLGVIAKPRLTMRILDYLHDEELTHFPISYFIGKSEWPEYERGLNFAIAQPH